MTTEEPIRRLYYGDCLTFMREHLPRASVDMIYVDPPFKAGPYNAIYKEETGWPLPEQIESPFDVWQLGEDREQALQALAITTQRTGLVDDSVEFARLWTTHIGNEQPGLLAYLTGMADRLLWMRAILRPTGSLFLHCDPSTVHYAKVMMDAIFGHANFRGEMRWERPKMDGSTMPSAGEDTILFYSASAAYEAANLPLADANATCDGVDFARNRSIAAFVPADHILSRYSRPTQRPVALLERLISASTKPGDVVFDPFCGSGPTIEAAERLGRQWIAADVAYHAVRRTAKHRLRDRLGFEESTEFWIEGMPFAPPCARVLWESDPTKFERWAVERTGAFITTQLLAGCSAVGRIHFTLPGATDFQSMVIRAFGRRPGASDFEALGALLDRGGVLMAGLVVIDPLGAKEWTIVEQIRTEVGDLSFSGIVFPRIQVRHLLQVLGGNGFQIPHGINDQLQFDF